MYKLSIMILIFSVGFIVYDADVYAIDYEWRCGNLFVSEGVHSFKVLEHCGEPVIKEEIGRSRSDNLEAIREKWVYGPNAGYYYVVYFRAGIVEKVESFRHDE